MKSGAVLGTRLAFMLVDPKMQLPPQVRLPVALFRGTFGTDPRLRNSQLFSRMACRAQVRVLALNGLRILD
jgi:hypothetical protein